MSGPPSKGVCGLVALACLGAAAFIASHHPLWPAAALLGIGLVFVVEWRRPGSWLFLVPAGLPLLNFSPWTGWLTFEEFDLLALATLAGGYFGLVRQCRAPKGDCSRATRPAPWRVLVLLFGGLSFVALWAGVRDAGGWSFSWFQGYTEPLNGVRVAKSSLLAWLTLPLIESQLHTSPRRATTRLCAGMTAGLAMVVLAALWERAAYPGLLNLSARYRTTALFWEMHVGGGAIDAYLALATPFVAWALSSARSVPRWSMAALLALATAYACLTTFSRGAYLAIAGPLPLLGALLLLRSRDLDARGRWHRAGLLIIAGAATAASLAVAFSMLDYPGLGLVVLVTSASLLAWKVRRSGLLSWRMLGSSLLVVALMAEVVVILSAGSFMLDRLSAADEDFAHRREHWGHGLGLLRTSSDWLFGRGLGRLPASYASEVPNGEFPGAVRIHASAGGASAATLYGPLTLRRIGGHFGIAQRVPREQTYHVRIDARSSKPVHLYLRVCERHVLYDGRCQLGFGRVAPAAAGWSRIELPLRGPALTARPWFAARSVVFQLSVIDAGGAVELGSIVLSGPGGANLLANGDFSNGLAHWQPGAQGYFLPWHIDNLYLELLIERGLPALLVFGALSILALWRLMSVARRSKAAPFLAAALSGALLVGLVSSLFDVPRVAYLFQLLVLFSLLATQRSTAAPFWATSVDADPAGSGMHGK